MAKHEWPEEQETSEVPVDSDEITTDADVEAPAEATEEATDEATEEASEGADVAVADQESAAKGPRRVRKLVALVVATVLGLGILAGGGFLGWKYYSAQAADTARMESVQVAKDSTIRLLSYKPDTVEQDLGSAKDLLTGNFRDSYTQLTNDVVIPGSKQQRISAVASVPAVASMSASRNHAQALVFVNQTVIVGDGAPTATASSVKVTLDKVDGHWLISGFDPV